MLHNEGDRPLDMSHDDAHSSLVELLPHLDELGELSGGIRYV